MKNYKVGDHIVMYHNGHRIVGTIETVNFTNNTVCIVADDTGCYYSGHPKQCRKLKPKVKRYCYGVVNSMGALMEVSVSKPIADYGKEKRYKKGKVIKLVETNNE